MSSHLRYIFCHFRDITSTTPKIAHCSRLQGPRSENCGMCMEWDSVSNNCSRSATDRRWKLHVTSHTFNTASMQTFTFAFTSRVRDCGEFIHSVHSPEICALQARVIFALTVSVRLSQFSLPEKKRCLVNWCVRSSRLIQDPRNRYQSKVHGRISRTLYIQPVFNAPVQWDSVGNLPSDLYTCEKSRIMWLTCRQWKNVDGKLSETDVETSGQTYRHQYRRTDVVTDSKGQRRAGHLLYFAERI